MSAVPANAARGESLNAVWVEFIVEMLSAAGVRHAVLCPGGRASAMCLALDAHPRIAVEMISTDERSGAFVALGIAKASGAPVAIVTTSGSAVANVLPALTEADACGVALVVVTCDRPHGLRGAGFGQMADHLGATRAFVRAQADLADPEDSVQAVAQARGEIAAVLAAMFDGVPDISDSLSHVDAHPSSMRPTRGPVHLNVPLAGVYDALETQPVSFETVRAARAARARNEADGGAYASTAPHDRVVSLYAESRVADTPAARIVERVMARVLARRGNRALSDGLDGLIVVGPEPGVPPEAILALAAASGFPVLADAGSGLRSGPFALAPQAAAQGAAGALIVNAFDVFGGAARLASARAELIVRFGLAPVMPVLHAYLETHADVPTIKIASCRVAHDYLHPALDPRDVLVAASPATLHDMAAALCEAVAVPLCRTAGAGASAGAGAGAGANASASAGASASASANASASASASASAGAGSNEPAQPAAPVAFCWRDRWASVAAYGARERRACVAALPWGEVSAVHRVLAAPGFAFVHLGNSMSMRHADIGYDVRAARQAIYVNRGVSGIDGTLATFIGEALARRDTGLLLLGDQALIHDLSSLASAQRVTTPACICVLDNGGGAIFDFLPISQAPAYRRTIRNPYQFEIGALAQAFGLAHRRVEARDTLDEALAEARDHAGVTIVEVAVEPYSGALQLQQLAQALGAA